jgi:hypothetical protein
MVQKPQGHEEADVKCMLHDFKYQQQCVQQLQSLKMQRKWIHWNQMLIRLLKLNAIEDECFLYAAHIDMRLPQ